MSKIEMKKIATIENDFVEKFGIPRQSGLAEHVISKIVFEPEYRDSNALRGLEAYSHIWLLWIFSENINKSSNTKMVETKWRSTVRPPRLGGNRRVGVFATRSPFRPNPIGLSSVKIERIELDTKEGPAIYVSGADLMNGTPIVDIKPYLPYVDCHPEAKGSFSEEKKNYRLKVEIPEEIRRRLKVDESVNDLSKCQEQNNADALFRCQRQNCVDHLSVCQEQNSVAALIEILSHDPRPSYQNDPERIYGLTFGPFEVKFRVVEDVLYVVNVDERFL